MPAPRTVYNISPSPDSTLAVEVRKTGLIKRKHLFVFEQYSGTLAYNPDEPLDSTLNLTVEAGSLIVRDASSKPRQQRKLARFALSDALQAKQHPVLLLQSERFIAKQLRGFVVEGKLCFRQISRPFKANIGFGVPKKNRLQIDADSTLRLSDYGIRPPSSLLGLIRTEDDVVLHALLWGTSAS